MSSDRSIHSVSYFAVIVVYIYNDDFIVVCVIVVYNTYADMLWVWPLFFGMYFCVRQCDAR